MSIARAAPSRDTELVTRGEAEGGGRGVGRRVEVDGGGGGKQMGSERTKTTIGK